MDIKGLRHISIYLCVIAFAGCAAIAPTREDRQVRITSSPEGASIYKAMGDSDEICPSTPSSYSFTFFTSKLSGQKLIQGYWITARLSGYIPQDKLVDDSVANVHFVLEPNNRGYFKLPDCGYLWLDEILASNFDVAFSGDDVQRLRRDGYFQRSSRTGEAVLILIVNGDRYHVYSRDKFFDVGGVYDAQSTTGIQWDVNSKLSEWRRTIMPSLTRVAPDAE